MSLAGLRSAGFDVLTRNQAEAILTHDFPAELAELVRLMYDVRIDRSLGEAVDAKALAGRS